MGTFQGLVTHTARELEAEKASRGKIETDLSEQRSRSETLAQRLERLLGMEETAMAWERLALAAETILDNLIKAARKVLPSEEDVKPVVDTTGRHLGAVVDAKEILEAIEAAEEGLATGEGMDEIPSVINPDEVH